jgi:fumarate reductase subunit D
VSGPRERRTWRGAGDPAIQVKGERGVGARWSGIMAQRSNEPFLWLLFSAGGVLSAILMPILVFLFGVAFPLGWLPPPTHPHLVAVVGHPLARILLFFLCVLSLFHWAHRFRYTLYDGLQIKHLNEVINAFCYGGAVLGSVAAAYLLLFGGF